MDIGFALLMGNTSDLPSPSVRVASRISSARPHSRTRCSRFAFMRGAGMVHTRSSMSISSHRAPRTSPERAVVSTRNSNTSLTIGRADEARTAATAAATFSCGSARMCLTMAFCGPRTGPSRSHGLSARYCIAMAHRAACRPSLLCVRGTGFWGQHGGQR